MHMSISIYLVWGIYVGSSVEKQANNLNEIIEYGIMKRSESVLMIIGRIYITYYSLSNTINLARGFYVGSSVQKEADDLYVSIGTSNVQGSVSTLSNIIVKILIKNIQKRQAEMILTKTDNNKAYSHILSVVYCTRCFDLICGLCVGSSI